MTRLTADEGRRCFLWCQGFLGAGGEAERRRAGVPGMLRRVGAVQLDTISVLARSHELVAYARLGPVGRAAVEGAYWGHPARAFEYWAHAASVIPVEDWPWFAVKRRRVTGPQSGRIVDDGVARDIRARLAEGPATATDLSGGKRPGGAGVSPEIAGEWWSWSDVKVAVERMLERWEVACVERRGWRRVYDLTERVIPSELLAHEPTDDECRVELVRKAAARLGVATLSDLADYYRLRKTPLVALLPDTGLVPVSVEGWTEPAWADPDALAALSDGRLRPGLRSRTTFLSPFDSLVWDRARTERIFGWRHRLEAYVPKDKRVHGYFVMPLLAGGRIVGRVDPARAGRTLVARRLSLAGRAAVRPAAAALVEAASWVGCDAVNIEIVDPAELAAPLSVILES